MAANTAAHAEAGRVRAFNVGLSDKDATVVFQVYYFICSSSK